MSDHVRLVPWYDLKCSTESYADVSSNNSKLSIIHCHKKNDNGGLVHRNVNDTMWANSRLFNHFLMTSDQLITLRIFLSFAHSPHKQSMNSTRFTSGIDFHWVRWMTIGDPGLSRINAKSSEINGIIRHQWIIQRQWIICTLFMVVSFIWRTQPWSSLSHLSHLNRVNLIKSTIGGGNYDLNTLNNLYLV